MGSIAYRTAAAALVALLGGAPIAAADAPGDDIVPRSFCDAPPHDQLCAALPQDATDFDSSFIYHLLEKNAQNPFDIFSWQSFVALNWPATADGSPVDAPLGSRPGRPRVWQFFKQPGAVFGAGEARGICGDSGPAVLATSTFLQSSGQPLIDRALNFVVFDTRMNERSERYIIASGLQTRAGQEAFRESGRQVDFPRGYYDDKALRTGGAAGAIELKTAWQILADDAHPADAPFYTIDGLIAVPARYSATGEAVCIEARLGLIGMHIMHRTLSGNGGDWIWSTFEHVDAAPVAENSLDPNSILGELFAGGCRAPREDRRRYLLFDGACLDCATNTIAPARWLWASDAPFARRHAVDGRFGTQVVRCWQVFSSTAHVNAVWRAKLGDTVWRNYRLISTQWRGAPGSAVFPNGEVPRYLTNVALETYEQFAHNGTCLGCHAKAVTLAGQDANFSFLPSKAK